MASLTDDESFEGFPPDKKSYQAKTRKRGLGKRNRKKNAKEQASKVPNDFGEGKSKLAPDQKEQPATPSKLPGLPNKKSTATILPEERAGRDHYQPQTPIYDSKKRSFQPPSDEVEDDTTVGDQQFASDPSYLFRHDPDASPLRPDSDADMLDTPARHARMHLARQTTPQPFPDSDLENGLPGTPDLRAHSQRKPGPTTPELIMTDPFNPPRQPQRQFTLLHRNAVSRGRTFNDTLHGMVNAMQRSDPFSAEDREPRSPGRAEDGYPFGKVPSEDDRALAHPFDQPEGSELDFLHPLGLSPDQEHSLPAEEPEVAQDSEELGTLSDILVSRKPVKAPQTPANHVLNAVQLQVLCKPAIYTTQDGLRVHQGLPFNACTRELIKLPSVKYTAQTVVWQILYIMGVRIEPFMTQDASAIPTELLRTAFLKLGHFPAFLEIKNNANVKAHYTKRPTSLSLVGFGVECPSCKSHHDDYRAYWLVVMLIGSGRLDAEDMDVIMQKSLQLSHTCGYAWCINPFCIVIEDSKANNSRKSCHQQRGLGDYAAECDHSDPCCLEEVDFGKRYDHCDQKLKDLKLLMQDSCTIPRCSFSGRGVEVMFHMMKEHATDIEPPRSAEELLLECGACGKLLKNWKAGVRHSSDIKSSRPCPGGDAIGLDTLTAAFKERGRTLLGGLDSYLWV